MKVLVLGATGMLGHMVCRVLADDHAVYAAHRSAADASGSLAAILPSEMCFSGLDCTDMDRLSALLDSVVPDFVINAVGIVKQRREATDPLESIRINALFPHQLAQLCDTRGARVMQISTDCVFSGSKGSYREADAPDPVDLYGHSKFLGELAGDRHLTIRTSIIGPQPNGDTGLVAWLLSQRGGEIEGYTNAIFSGLTTHALSLTLKQLLERPEPLGGLYHVASPPISKLDLLTQINRALELDITIRPNDEFRCDRSLDDSLFRTASDVQKAGWAEMINQLVMDLE